MIAHSRIADHSRTLADTLCLVDLAGFDQRKKRPVVANAAIARELAGWCWSLAVMHD